MTLGHTKKCQVYDVPNMKMKTKLIKKKSSPVSLSKKDVKYS